MIVIIRVGTCIAFNFNAVFCIHLHFIALLLLLLLCGRARDGRDAIRSWAIIIDRNVIAVVAFIIAGRGNVLWMPASESSQNKFIYRGRDAITHDDWMTKMKTVGDELRRMQTCAVHTVRM